MSRQSEDKTEYLLLAFSELIGVHGDDIRNNRRRAMNIVEDILSHYRPEMNFIKSAISEGILESLLDISALDENEKMMRLNRAKLNASQTMGFDREFASHILDLFVLAVDEDISLSITTEDEEYLNKLTKEARRLFMLREVNLYEEINDMDLSSEELEIINKGFTNYEDSYFEKIVFDLLVKLTENRDDLWTLFEVEGTADAIKICAGTKIFGRAIEIKIFSFFFYDGTTNCGGELSILSDVKSVDKIADFKHEVHMLNALKRSSIGRPISECIVECKKIAREKALYKLSKEYRAAAEIPSNKESLGSKLDGRYNRYVSSTKDYSFLPYSVENCLPDLEALLLELTEHSELVWKQVEIITSNPEKLTGIFVTRLGEVGVVAYLSFTHKTGTNAVLNVEYNFIKPGELEDSDKYKGQIRKRLYDALKLHCEGFTFNKEFTRYVKKSNEQIENDIDKRIATTERLTRKLRDGDDYYLVWNFSKYTERISNKELLDLSKIIAETKAGNVFWKCIGSKPVNRDREYAYVTCFANTLIRAEVLVHEDKYGGIHENISLIPEKDYGIPSSKTTAEGQFSKVVKKAEERLNILNENELKEIEEEKNCILAKFASDSDTPRMRIIRNSQLIKFDINNFFKPLNKKETERSLYELYYLDKELYDNILMIHEVDPLLIEFVTSHELMDSMDAFIEYKVCNKIRFSHDDLYAATKKEVICWGDKVSRWGPNNTRIAQYSAFYKGNAILSMDDKDMPNELLVLVKQSNMKNQ